MGSIGDISRMLRCLAISVLSGGSDLGESSPSSVSTSRTAVEQACRTPGFGWGDYDFIEIALLRLYETPELCQKYGDSFEAQDFAGKHVPKSRTALCRAVVQGDVWEIRLTKSRFGKWNATGCFLADKNLENWTE